MYFISIRSLGLVFVSNHFIICAQSFRLFLHR
jgi:hypothetical protein